MNNILVYSGSCSTEDLQAVRELLISCLAGVRVDVKGFRRKEENGSFDPFAWDMAGYDGLIQVEDRGNDGLEGSWIATEKKVTVKLSGSECQAVRDLPSVGREKTEKIVIKHLIQSLLKEVLGMEVPWGSLTGMRPTKLLHRMINQGINEKERDQILSGRYHVREDKVVLLERVGRIQNPILEKMKANPQQTAVYVGIPFCPSHCSYCTFPGYIPDQERSEVKIYLKALALEIAAVGQMMKELGLTVGNLYLGGGTPTVLNGQELETLITQIKENLPMDKEREFTVEGGRPDTLKEETLSCLKDQGVNRISINPQTMNEKTLVRIGRAHHVDEVVEAFRRAREMHDWIINADIILGLPGEEVADVQNTLEAMTDLHPDNLTIHALAIKRGSREWEEGLTSDLTDRIEKMQKAAVRQAESWGMVPYYLYRQRKIAGNLENIGFALPGKESRYNIAIMEEWQHVFGLGAGAASKIISAQAGALENMQHPSYWKSYLEGWTKVHDRRRKILDKQVRPC